MILLNIIYIKACTYTRSIGTCGQDAKGGKHQIFVPIRMSYPPGRGGGGGGGGGLNFPLIFFPLGGNFQGGGGGVTSRLPPTKLKTCSKKIFLLTITLHLAWFSGCVRYNAPTTILLYILSRCDVSLKL